MRQRRGKAKHFTWVNHTVTFNSRKRRGKVIDEEWADRKLIDSQPGSSSHSGKEADFSFCSQFIEWDDGKYSIRLAYFKRDSGKQKWRYVSRTAPTSNPRIIEKLLKKTLAQKHWFLKPA